MEQYVFPEQDVFLGPTTFRRCYVYLIDDDNWWIRCGVCSLEWPEPISQDLVVAVTCPHCRAMQCVIYPDGIAYHGPLMET